MIEDLLNETFVYDTIQELEDKNKYLLEKIEKFKQATKNILDHLHQSNHELKFKNKFIEQLLGLDSLLPEDNKYENIKDLLNETFVYDTIQELEEKNEYLLKKIEKFKQATKPLLNNLKQNNHDLKMKVQIIQGMEELERLLSSQNDSNDNKHEELENLKQKNHQLNNDLSSKKNELNVRKIEQEKDERENNDLNKQLKRVNEENQTLTTAKEKLVQEKEEVQSKLDDSNKAKEKLVQEKQDLTDEIQNLNETAAINQQKITDLNKAKETLTEQLNTVNQENQTLTTAKEKLVQEKQDLTDEIQSKLDTVTPTKADVRTDELETRLQLLRLPTVPSSQPTPIMDSRQPKPCLVSVTQEKADVSNTTLDSLKGEMLEKIVNNLSYYNKTPVSRDGSCFYHSLAFGLNNINITHKGAAIDDKYLRQICINYFQNHKNNPLFQKQIKNELKSKYTLKYPDKNIIYDQQFIEEIDKYSSHENIIKYIDEYITKGVDNHEWGRPDIEGKIICEFFLSEKIHIHLVTPNKIGDSLVYSHVLYTPDGDIVNLIESEEFVKYYDILIHPNTICVFHTGNNHFEYAVFSPTILQSQIIDNRTDWKQGDKYNVDNTYLNFLEEELNDKPLNLEKVAQQQKTVFEQEEALFIKNSDYYPKINYISDPIIITKHKYNNWNIEILPNIKNEKIKKTILLNIEENKILNNLIEQKINITIIFCKKTKKFKEAFFINKSENKIIINIKNKQQKILEKLNYKIRTEMASSLTQSDINKINNFNNQKEPTKSPYLTNAVTKLGVFRT